MDKLETHPILYIALGSHGIYPRRGIYIVDDPHLDAGEEEMDADLIEVAGGGCRISYTDENLSINNPCDVKGSLEIISSYPIPSHNMTLNLSYLISPLNTLGESYVKDRTQNDVRFFPYSEFFLSVDKLHCLNRLDKNNSLGIFENYIENYTNQALVGAGSVAPINTNNIITNNYDLLVENVALKAKDDYCKSIIVDKFLFPPEDYLPEFLNIETNGNTVKIEGEINPVYWDANGNIHNGNTYKEIVDLLPKEGYKLLINWNVSSGNSTWEEIETFSKTVLLTGNVKFSSEHTYTTSGNYTIGLRLVTPNGAYVEKFYPIEIEEIKEKGNIQGAVKDAVTMEPLEDVKVSLIDINNNTVAETTTNSDGNYNFNEVPVGNYTIIFSKEGYLPATGTVTVEANSTTIYPTLMQIDTEHGGNGTVQGIVKDATNGNPISGVTIKVFKGINNVSGTPIATISTSEDGSYQTELPAGYYTFVLSKDGYRGTSYYLSVLGNTTNTKEFTMSPNLSENEIRIVLTWGETPSDLDAHLVKVKDGSTEYHLYWYYADSCPDHGNCHGSPTEEANLDIDDITSFGPETITIHNIDPNATYKYYVHDYSNMDNHQDEQLADSQATVKVYWGNETYTYYVPNGIGNAWKVFEIVNGTLIPCTKNCLFGVDEPTDSQFGTRSAGVTFSTFDQKIFKNLPAKH